MAIAWDIDSVPNSMSIEEAASRGFYRIEERKVINQEIFKHHSGNIKYEDPAKEKSPPGHRC